MVFIRREKGVYFYEDMISVNGICRYLVDEFHDSLYMNGVYILSAVVFILIFFVNPLAEYYKEKNVSGMMRSLKDRMADKLLYFSLEYYTNVDRGKSYAE